MTWNVELTVKVEKQIQKLDIVTRTEILNFLASLELLDDPRQKGKPLLANLRYRWRYRVGKYRIICEIKNKELVVLVLSVAKRDLVYEGL